jgi:hypothetical protein
MMFLPLIYSPYHNVQRFRDINMVQFGHYFLYAYMSKGKFASSRHII